MKKIKNSIVVLSIAICISSCGFDLSFEDATIELPNTYGINVEAVFEVPELFIQHDVNFDEIVVAYKVRKNDAFVANVKIYVSAAQTADNVQLPGDEDVISVTLGVNETEKGGVVTSALLIDILNNKQPYFVIGCQNLSAAPISSVFIDLDVKCKGSYKL